jgi:hypothetical protein
MTRVSQRPISLRAEHPINADFLISNYLIPITTIELIKHLAKQQLYGPPRSVTRIGF